MEPQLNTFEIDLDRFSTIMLSTLGKEHLQDRVDTKFALHQSSLRLVLRHLENTHTVLSVDGICKQQYKNLYFDDDRLSFYLHHHDKKGNRCKVRLREYGNSNTVVFEVKQKINKNRTMKQRIAHSALIETLSAEAQNLVQQFAPVEAGSLRPTLWCHFNRITLLSPNQEERMTIDYNIQVGNTKHTKIYDGLALIEVKHASHKPSSFDVIAKQSKIRKMSLSKYVMGIAHLNPEVKQNNFRLKLLAIDKIMNNNGAQYGI